MSKNKTTRKEDMPHGGICIVNRENRFSFLAPEEQQMVRDNILCDAERRREGARQSQRGKHPKPQRRNPKLHAYVQSRNMTPGRILAQLELMTNAERRRAIGTTKLLGLTTIKSCKKADRLSG
jgi:hypothetical protein